MFGRRPIDFSDTDMRALLAIDQQMNLENVARRQLSTRFLNATGRKVDIKTLEQQLRIYYSNPDNQTTIQIGNYRFK
jgi:hypothetical protein